MKFLKLIFQNNENRNRWCIIIEVAGDETSGNEDQGREEVHEARLTALTMFTSPETRPQDESLDRGGQEIRVES